MAGRRAARHGPRYPRAAPTQQGSCHQVRPETLERMRLVPRVLITDKLGSHAAAKNEVWRRVEHRKHKRLNNRVEHSHQPTRQRERTMRGFTSAGHAPRFLSACGPIREHCCPRRHRFRAAEYRQERARRMEVWNEVTSLQMAAETSCGRAVPQPHRS